MLSVFYEHSKDDSKHLYDTSLSKIFCIFLYVNFYFFCVSSVFWMSVSFPPQLPIYFIGDAWSTETIYALCTIRILLNSKMLIYFLIVVIYFFCMICMSVWVSASTNKLLSEITAESKSQSKWWKIPLIFSIWSSLNCIKTCCFVAIFRFEILSKFSRVNVKLLWFNTH